jgi:polyphosphate kinase
LLHSPFTLHKGLMQKIAAEAEHAEAGRAARILIKVNALIEPQLIQALYRASQAGVEIDLIVRGMCSLRPGVRGISDRIRVRSIVGRFLEHTRVFYFLNGGNAQVYASSADWMERNMFRRVEVCFPLENTALRDRVIEDLEWYLKDNTHAWLLASDGSYQLTKPAQGEAPFSAQDALLESFAEDAPVLINKA